MTEQEVSVFTGIIENYFEEFTGKKAVVDKPYIKEEEKIILSCTGLIGISGKRKGTIYITAHREMLVDIAKVFLKTDELDDEIVLDMIGELANTIAGNAKQHFGSDFLISIPSIIDGAPNDIRIKLELPVYVIPFFWKGQKAFVVVGIE